MNSTVGLAVRTLQGTLGKIPALLLLAAAILLPVLPSAAIIVAYGALLWMALTGPRQFQWRPTFWRTLLPWMAAFFLLHVLGMLWTSNVGFGLFDLQIKLPLLALPLLICFIDRRQWHGRDVLLFAFTLMNAAMVVIFTLAAVVRIGMGGPLAPSQQIFSSYWSLFLHPSYFALYLTFAIAAWCLLPIHRWLPRSWSTVVLYSLCLGVVLCGSKVGWMLFIPVLLTLLFMLRKERPVRNALAGLLLFSALGIIVLVAASPFARDRVVEMMRAMGEEHHSSAAVTSSEVRWLTWGTARDLFLQHPWSGVGTGDIKDETVKAYTALGYTGAAERRLNAHDQYLQTAACLGISGVLILCALVLVPLLAPRPRDPVIVIFVLLNAVNWTVESMLEVQAGSVFFSFIGVIVLWDRGQEQ